MAIIGNLLINLMAKTAGFDRSMSKSEKRVKSFSRSARSMRGSMMGLGKSMLAGAGIGLGLAALIRGFKGTIRAAIEQEQADADLAASLKQVGVTAKGALGDLKRFAAGLQQVTRYGDELTQGAMTRLVNIGGLTGETLKRATIASMGLAAKLKIDLNTATLLVARAAKGQTQTLTRYGIVLNETLTSQQKFTELLRQGEDAFELTKESAKTTGGQFQQLKNAFGDANEAIGTMFTKMKDGLSGVQLFTEGIERWTESLNALSALPGGNWFENILAQILAPISGRDVNNLARQSARKLNLEEQRRAARKRFLAKFPPPTPPPPPSFVGKTLAETVIPPAEIGIGLAGQERILKESQQAASEARLRRATMTSGITDRELTAQTLKDMKLSLEIGVEVGREILRALMEVDN